jgi:hypothetical protein
MQTRANYLQASFFSFLIHAALFLYLIGFFYSEKQLRPILSKPVTVNIIVDDLPNKNIKQSESTKVLKKVTQTSPVTIAKDSALEIPKISSEGSIINLEDLLNQELEALDSNQLENEINQYSSLIINLIESAWIKPKNIQQSKELRHSHFLMK